MCTGAVTHTFASRALPPTHPRAIHAGGSCTAEDERRTASLNVVKADKEVCIGFNTQDCNTASRPIPLYSNKNVQLSCSGAFGIAPFIICAYIAPHMYTKQHTHTHTHTHTHIARFIYLHYFTICLHCSHGVPPCPCPLAHPSVTCTDCFVGVQADVFVKVSIHDWQVCVLCCLTYAVSHVLCISTVPSLGALFSSPTPRVSFAYRPFLSLVSHPPFS